MNYKEELIKRDFWVESINLKLRKIVWNYVEDNIIKEKYKKR